MRIALLLALLAFAGQSSAAPYQAAADTVDQNTRCFGVSCCPLGSALRGVNLGTHKLECRNLFEPRQDCFIDHAAARGGVQACPDGTYMRGLDGGRKLFVCCYDQSRGYTPFAAGSESLDTKGPIRYQGNLMRTCDESPSASSVMTGLDGNGGNRLLCARPDGGAPGVPALATSFAIAPEKDRSLASAFPLPNAVDPAAYREWKKANRNWIARIFNIPTSKWIALNSTGRLAPPVYQWVSKPQECPDGPCDTTVKGDKGSARRRMLKYRSPVDGRWIYAYLFTPITDIIAPIIRAPAMLVLHGHPIQDHFWDPGHGTKYATSIDAQSNYRAGAFVLAQQGLVTLAPDTRTFGQSAQPADCPGPSGNCHGVYAEARPEGRLVEEYEQDNLANLSILLDQPEVDPARVYVGGLSLGGRQALWLAALDPRLKGVYAAGSYLGYGCDSAKPSDRCQEIPALSSNLDDWHVRLSTIFDIGDFAAVTAPARILSTFGTNTSGEENYGTECYAKALNDTITTYQRLNIPSDFVHYANQGHVHQWEPDEVYSFVNGR